MKLIATTTDEDARRCYRLMIAWVDGDRLAMDIVLGEVMADPIGTPGLLFALVEFATDIGGRAVPGFREQLRAGLLALEGEGNDS